jgi:peroxiredoxin
MGVQRTTFLLDEDGVVTRVWREITAERHATKFWRWCVAFLKQ